MDLLHYVNVFSVLGSPKPNTALQKWSHKCQIEGKNHHFPSLAGYPPPNVAQDAAGLCQKGTLMTIRTLGPFLQTCFLSSQCCPVLLHGLIPPQMQDFAFAFGKFREVPDSPFLQPDKVPQTAALPSSVVTTLPNSYNLQTCKGCPLPSHPSCY